MCRILFLLLITSFAGARELSIGQQNVAAYFRASYGLSNLGKDLYNDSSGTGTSFSESVEANHTGEIGFLITQNAIGLRAGIEFFASEKMTDIEGKNTAGALQTTLTSQLKANILKAGLEFNLSNTNSTKTYVVISGGTANITLINTYDDANNSPADFANYAEATAVMGELIVGYEFQFADNATLMLDAGYRSMKVSKLTFDRDLTNYQGAQTTGDSFKDNAGNNIALDLGGYFAGIGIRFYLNY